MSERYHNSDRKAKCLNLSELEINLKIHRKSAVRLINGIKNKKPKETRGRRRVYNDFIILQLKKLWLDMGNITPVKFHDLRATFITNLLSQGVPLVKVMSIVGHKKLETTDIYLRLAGVDIKGATDALSYSVPTISTATNIISVNFGHKS